MKPSSRENQNWTNIKEVLSRSIRESNAHYVPEKLNIHWNLIVGRELVAVTRVDRLRSKTLHICVTNKKWIPVLRGLEKKIVNELNCVTRPNLVSRLTFHEDKNILRDSVEVAKTVAKKSRFSPIPLDGDKRALKMIKDIELRDVLRRLEQKLRFFLLVVWVTFFGFVSNCTIDPNYQAGKNSFSRTYAGNETLHKPTSVQMISSKNSTVNKITSEDNLHQAEKNKRSASKHIQERNKKFLQEVLDLHKKKQFPKRKDPEAYYNFLLALKAEKKGDFDAAVDFYRMVLAHDPATEKFYIKLAHLYQSNGDLDQAVAVCRNGLDRFPKNAGLLLTLGEILSARGENQKALSYLQKISINSHNKKALLLIGNIQSQIKDYAQAEKTLKKAVLIDSRNPLGYHFLGRNYALNKQFPEAEESLRKALKLRPSLTNTRILLAWIMERLGNFQQAENEYKILRKIDPENGEIQKKLAQLKLENSYDHGNPTVLEAGPFPQDSNLHLKLGMIFYEKSQHIRALLEFRLFLGKEDNKEIRFLIARIYELFKNYSKAIDELEILFKQEPESVELLLHIARLHHLDENTDRAVDVLKIAARLQPENDQIYHSLSLAYLAKNQREKAIEFIRKALELNNDKATYYFQLGALLEQVDHIDEAIESMREVLRIDPRHSNAHNFIGYLYAIQGEKLDQAIDHLEKALAVQPQNGYFLDSLGWIYFQQGNSEQALVEIKKAMIYTSPDPVIYDHLGDVQFDLKNYDEAEKAWKISLSLTNRKKEEVPPDAEMPDINVLEEKLQKLDIYIKQSF